MDPRRAPVCCSRTSLSLAPFSLSLFHIYALTRTQTRASPSLPPTLSSPTITLTHHAQDLWTHTANGTAVRNFTAHAVPPHGVAALLLTDAGDEPAGAGPPCARLEWCIDRNGTLAPGA